jgi:hypothetical protein
MTDEPAQVSNRFENLLSTNPGQRCPASDTSSVQIDWGAYYLLFKEVHGDPIEYKGRLVFPDGWSYSKTDVSGPEWAPPEDREQLTDLQLGYWKGRLALVTYERDVLKQLAENIVHAQTSKSLPLPGFVTYREIDENGVPKTRRVELGEVITHVEDLLGPNARLAWLEEDIILCRAEIEKLTN